jgi:nucleoid-associated protein YgaU
LLKVQTMPNDAKLGLVVGVGVVITVAAVFFRKEAIPSLPGTGSASAASVGSPKPPSPATPRTPSRPVKGRQSGDNEGNAAAPQPAVRRHTVKDGETLFSLAEMYYGDKDKSDLILAANRDVLQNMDELRPGIRLLIPSPPSQARAALEDRQAP